jgi:hypothetical protein
VVARTPEQDQVGFISMWRPCSIAWWSAPRQDHASEPVQAFLRTREGRIFDWFTMGWGRYRLERTAGGAQVWATDLRYGFTGDPDRSIFSATAPIGLGGSLAGPVQAGGDVADATGQRLRLLFQDTYTPTCML